jgi:hypothetical protein
MNVRAEPAGVNPKITPVYPVSGNLIKSPTCTDDLQLFKAKTKLITLWKVDLYHPVALNQGDKAEHARVIAPPQADTHRIDHNQVTDLH